MYSVHPQMSHPQIHMLQPSGLEAPTGNASNVVVIIGYADHNIELYIPQTHVLVSAGRQHICQRYCTAFAQHLAYHKQPKEPVRDAQTCLQEMRLVPGFKRLLIAPPAPSADT